eukprot:m.446454 g.446454  ORF g.446454 m.446454 type:complete len:410 (+) comp19364_c0_seq1:160-1389(+)
MPKFSVPNSGVLVVLAVLLGEYIIMALPRAVIPKYQAAAFGEDVITVAAVTEAVKGVFALISNLTLGQLSDSWGRKTLLLITATGTVLPQALLAFSDNMWAYQVALALSGMFAATWSVTLATITDLEPEDTLRMRWFGLAMSCMAASLIIGPGIGAAVCSGPQGCTPLFRALPYLVAGNAALIAVGVPYDTLPKGVDDGSGQKPAVLGMGTIALFRGSSELRLLGCITAFYFLPVYGVISTLLVYLHRTHAFAASDGAMLLSLMGITAMVSCTLGVPLAQSRGITPAGTVRAGLCSLATSLLVFGCGTRRLHFLGGGVALGGAFVTMPGVNALVSLSALPTEQGAAQGGINGIKAVTEGLGPLLFAAIFATASETIPGAPFLVGALLVLVTIALVDRVATSGVKETDVK